MSLVSIKDNEIVIAQEVLKELKEWEIKRVQQDIKEKELRKAILEAMEANNIKKFENDDIRITYIAPTVRKSVDSQKLKDEGLYELYLKESNVKSSVKLEIK